AGILTSMPHLADLNDLLDYTDWDRAQWHTFFKDQGAAALAVGLGANSDGKIKDIGELIRHIFSAETRYVQRCLGVPLTDTSKVAADAVETLFTSGEESRRALRELVATSPDDRWEVPQEVFGRRVTPRKMIVQAVPHEIRHWAQIATLLRLEGR